MPATIVVAGILHHTEMQRWYSASQQSSSSSPTQSEAAENNKEAKPVNEENASIDNQKDQFFDLTDTLGHLSKARDDFLKTIRPERDEDHDSTVIQKDIDEESTIEEGRAGFFESIKDAVENAVGKTVTSLRPEDNDGDDFEETFQAMGRNMMKLLSNSSNDSIDDVVEQVREMKGRGDVQDQEDITELYNVARECLAMLDSKLDTFFGEKGRPSLYLTSMVYFIEREDEIKNPSWKRRKHRFFPGIDMAKMDDCYDKMVLSALSYADSVEKIREQLRQEHNSELVYCSLVSRPNKPAHFIAVKRDQSKWSNELEILLVVRGTQSVTDVVTDLLCDAAPYRGGLAHAGITTSGQWLVKKHTGLLDRLKKLTKKRKIKLTIVGHSLGAGAATIAGIEWHDSPFIDVQVFGFGCPALLSKNLSQKCESFVTTVVNDSDCVPRMSMASMVNALMSITELDITPYAQQDFEETVNEMQRFFPSLVDGNAKRKILENLNGLLPEAPSSVDIDQKKRMDVILFPPGKVLHFYRDGFGVTASVTPCTFFDELEVTRRFLADHSFESGYERTFLDLMRQYHNDNFYVFDRKKMNPNSSQ